MSADANDSFILVIHGPLPICTLSFLGLQSVSYLFVCSVLELCVFKYARSGLLYLVHTNQIFFKIIRLILSCRPCVLFFIHILLYLL